MKFRALILCVLLLSPLTALQTYAQTQSEVFSNNAASVLSSGITTGDTTISVSDGSSFPTLGGIGLDFFWATIQSGTTIEVVKVNAHTVGSANMTVTRAQQGTTATAFPAGARFEQRVTASTLSNFPQASSLASGDLFYGSAAATLSRLQVGGVAGMKLTVVGGFPAWVSAYSLSAVTVLTSGTSATYTVPGAVVALMVECVGGGGGGGGADGAASNSGFASGGGGGGYARKFFTGLSATYTYTVGAAANGGVGQANGSAGTAGNSTSFSTMTCGGGGAGGASGTAASTVAFVAGGAGGTASGGDINIPGMPGGWSKREAAAQGWSGSGGNSEMGMGAVGAALTATGAAGTAGTAYGGGGSGGAAIGNTDRAGGNGAAGVIIIWEFK